VVLQQQRERAAQLTLRAEGNTERDANGEELVGSWGTSPSGGSVMATFAGRNGTVAASIMRRYQSGVPED